MWARRGLQCLSELRYILQNSSSLSLISCCHNISNKNHCTNVVRKSNCTLSAMQQIIYLFYLYCEVTVKKKTKKIKKRTNKKKPPHTNSLPQNTLSHRTQCNSRDTEPQSSYCIKHTLNQHCTCIRKQQISRCGAVYIRCSVRRLCHAYLFYHLDGIFKKCLMNSFFIRQEF